MEIATSIMPLTIPANGITGHGIPVYASLDAALARYPNQRGNVWMDAARHYNQGSPDSFIGKSEYTTRQIVNRLNRQLNDPSQNWAQNTRNAMAQNSTNARPGSANLRPSARPDATQIVSAVQSNPRPDDLGAEVVFVTELCSENELLTDPRKQIYIFPCTFKQVKVSFDGYEPFSINVPNLTFGELKTRLDDGRDGTATKLVLRHWRHGLVGWRDTWDEAVDMRWSVWEQLRQNDAVDYIEVVVQRISR